jgi:predicted sugar kinase
MDCLAREGAHGIGQSSWGPTGFAFAEGDREAERLAEIARRRPDAQALDIRVVSAVDRGGQISETAALSEQSAQRRNAIRKGGSCDA